MFTRNNFAEHCCWRLVPKITIFSQNHVCYKKKSQRLNKCNKDINCITYNCFILIIIDLENSFIELPHFHKIVNNTENIFLAMT